MNFLEAFDELDLLNEANLRHQVPPRIKYGRVNGKCPACEKHFSDPDTYEQHIINDKECRDEIIATAPARIKVGKKGHSYDEMTNITAAGLLDYMAKHQVCEICGDNSPEAGIHPDHIHANDSSHLGTFRGVLCTQCNLLLGQIERRIGKQNSMHYEEYLNNIKRYMQRGEERAAGSEFEKPDMYYKYG